MAQPKTSTPSRHSRRQQSKARQRSARRDPPPRGWQPATRGKATHESPPAPQARGYLMREFWIHFRLGELLTKVGVKPKLKGLPVATLMLVLLLFGVTGARSNANLAEQLRTDQTLVALCWVEGLERKQLYRLLGKVSDRHYLDWLGEIVRELHRDPRTATRREGVLAGDDTVVFKSGKKMPYVTVVYKSSGPRFGLGNIIVSLHYVDAQKDYPVGFDFWRPTAEEIKAREEARERKRLGLDQRKPQEVAAWLAHQVQAGRAPDLALLQGAQVGTVVIQQCEALAVAWLGVATGPRVYAVQRPKKSRMDKGTAEEWRRQDYRRAEWQELTELGCRVVRVGQTELKGVGEVSLLLVEDQADQERTLYLTRPASDEQLLARLELALTQALDASAHSRLQVMLGLLRRARQAGVVAENVVFDRWFYVPAFILEVLALGFARVVIPVKRDIAYTYRGQIYTLDQFWKAVPARRFHPKTYRGRRVRLASVTVQQAGLGTLRLVLVKEVGAHGRILRRYALVCTDPATTPFRIFRIHKMRWKIEECYREVRQEHGLEQYHARDFNSNFGHVAASFLSYLCLSLTRLLTPKLRTKTLGQIKRLLFEARVELDRSGDVIRVKFSPQCWRKLGLPAYCER